MNSAVATSTSPLVATASVGRPESHGEGEALTLSGCAAAMLRLAEIFPVTTATDLALAGYDVLGHVQIGGIR